MSTLNDTTQIKRCSTCGEQKPLDMFHKDCSKKSGLSSCCKSCAIERSRKHHADNRETILEHRRQHYADNRDVERARRRQYYASNRDAALAYGRQYRAEHRDGMREYNRQYRANNHEEVIRQKRQYYVENRTAILAKDRQYRAANPDKVYQQSIRRRARKAAADGTYTSADIRAQLKRQKGRCYWCGKKVMDYHVDHVIPLSRGGSNGPENLVIACPSCNLSKGRKLPHEWNGGGGRMF